MNILRCIPTALLLLAVTAIHARADVLVGNAFTYQGRFTEDDNAVDGTADFEFTLWDDPLAGSQEGPTLTFDGVGANPPPVNVTDGLFTVQLDFGAAPFDGNARWLQIAVRYPSGGGVYTSLTPRQPLTPAPYALYALNAAGASDYWSLNGANLTNSEGDFVGIHRDTRVNVFEFFGVQAPVLNGYGGMYIRTDGADAWPYYGYRAGATAVWHYLDGATDKWHLNNSGTRLTVDNAGNVGIGTTNPTNRLHVVSNSGAAILALDNANAAGVLGQSVNGTGVHGMGIGASANGVMGESVDVNGLAVIGIHQNSAGTDPAVRGETHSRQAGAVGVHGHARAGTTISVQTFGARGESDSLSGVGVHGLVTANSGTGRGIWGDTRSATGYAGYFTGPSGSSSYFERRVGIGVLNPTDKLHVDGGDIRLDGGNRVLLYDNLGNQTVRLGASGSGGGGFLSLRNSNEVPVVELDSDDAPADQPAFRMIRDDGTPTGVVNIEMKADEGDAAPIIRLLDNGAETVRIDGRGAGGGGGIRMYNQIGHIAGDDHTVEIDASEGSGSAAIRLSDDIGSPTIELLAMETNTEGAAIKLYDLNGDATIILDAEFNGAGRIIAGEMQLTGADLAERIPASEALQPGMVVEIDPENAGRIRLSRSACNRRVAGIVSGAKNLSAGAVLGNLPGNENEPPVALSGRVYVWCDAAGGPIRPGDLLTTSATPGHAMKVIDHERAQGAVIGKAMTGLNSGRGLVLVLVSLQ